MPRVKFDYVVSFSSEDTENRAVNLLAGEVSKKKWLCTKGEPSCSVVLQLPRAIEISAVHIGAYHAALVEVLVGLSERPNDSFEVLVPSCVFVPPAQSRRDEGVDRVRSFTGEELTANTRGKRYDRVRVVCSQPYNKHCQYGLSFVHIHEPESRNDPPPAAAAPAVPFSMFAFDAYSTDEEEFRPGELFAKHVKSPRNSENPGNVSTDSQIRQATSHALKNISDSSSKILKTSISKAGSSRQKRTDEAPTNRQRDSIMYTDDDAKPHDKIDRVVNRHKDEKTKDDELNKTKVMDKEKNKEKNNGTSENAKKFKDRDNTRNKGNSDASIVNTNKKKERVANQSRNPQGNQSSRKRKRDDDSDTDASLVVGKVCKDVSQVLRGVTLVLSGYAGARRAALRDAALALGARYSPDWTPQCTHLICAFPNTPKLRTARASGGLVGAAKADWIEECLAHRRRLPWRWYATDPAERTPTQPLPEDPASSEGNTDDEIEKAMSSVKSDTRASRHSTPSPVTAGASPEDAALPDSDVSFVKDERFLGHVTLLDSDDDELTDVENHVTTEERIDATKALPDFFEGYMFVVTNEVVKESDREMLARYVRAFGGLLVEETEIDEDTQVDYVVCSEGNAWGDNQKKAVRVRPSWVWQCARERRLCAVDNHMPV